MKLASRLAALVPILALIAVPWGAPPGLGASQAPGAPAPFTPLVGEQDSQAGASKTVPEGLSTDDWSGIRAAYEAGRHAVYPVENGFSARNPGQQWLTRFDGRGFVTQPDAGGWTWGLELERYGFAGSELEVTKPERVTAEGGRVAYQWDAVLEEWYVNDTRGLEHGYTVRRRPARGEQGEAGALTFTLAVRGGLCPEVTADGRSVRFLDGEGGLALTYAGLVVFDADGQELEASLERVGARLLLSVDERGARYPLTIDPTAQQAYLKASNTDPFDKFGSSVAVSGDTVVVGAPGEASFATGVNGAQYGNFFRDAGAAYVFVRSAGSWSQQAYLKSANTLPLDLFGSSVAVSGDTVVVGSPGEAGSIGAAYVFVRNGSSWSQQASLNAFNPDPGDKFGGSVAVSGDTIAVGAEGEDSYFFPRWYDNSNQSAGAAYVFVRYGTSWGQEAYLKAGAAPGLCDPHDYFGRTVAVSNDTVVVGAPGEDSNATGVNGDQTNNSAESAGAAFVFVRTGPGLWSQQAYLKASNTETRDEFGGAVAASGDTVVVGAFKERSIATGVNGDQTNNSQIGAGAAYVFVRSPGGLWSQEAYLKASNNRRPFGLEFGGSVAMSGDTIVVGALEDHSGATGVNGNQVNIGAVRSGAAYVFVRSGGIWAQQAYLKASNTDAFDYFGGSVAASGDTVIVGAINEASNATGVNGDESNNSATSAGAAYAFTLDLSTLTRPFTDLGYGKSGITGIPALSGTGSLVGSIPGTLDLVNAAPTAPAFLFFGSSQSAVSIFGGTLVPVPILVAIGLSTDDVGESHLAFTWPRTAPRGSKLIAQYLIVDAAATLSVSFSNALALEGQGQ